MQVVCLNISWVYAQVANIPRDTAPHPHTDMRGQNVFLIMMYGVFEWTNLIVSSFKSEDFMFSVVGHIAG